MKLKIDGHARAKMPRLPGKKMRDGQSCCLLGKCQRKFPDEDDGRIHKNRERAVLKFPGQIAADPGVWAQNWPTAFRPTARDIGKHGQHRHFIIVIPENERIVPEKDETECNDK